MGVTQIHYKVAECDICGKKEEFRSSFCLPEGWTEIKDNQGYINYTCVCEECTKRVAAYIRELTLKRAIEAEGKHEGKGSE